MTNMEPEIILHADGKWTLPYDGHFHEQTVEPYSRPPSEEADMDFELRLDPKDLRPFEGVTFDLPE